MRNIEVALHNAAKLFKVLMNKNVEFTVDAAFESIKDLVGTFMTTPPVTSKDFRKKKGDEYAGWAMDACKGATSLIPHFMSKGQSSTMVELLGTWFQTEKPETQTATIAFDDGMVENHQPTTTTHKHGYNNNS